MSHMRGLIANRPKRFRFSDGNQMHPLGWVPIYDQPPPIVTGKTGSWAEMADRSEETFEKALAVTLDSSVSEANHV